MSGVREKGSDWLPIVDALRALAVTVVVTYHAGFPYVGVDVFFVISGFLIISHIIKEVEAGTFSFAAFYARRALRILPPYFLVVVASILIAWFILALPSEFAEFGREVFWSGVMLANHYFLSQQGYFDTSAELKPLLHLWSLAVEEQFYLVTPLIIAGLWALYRKTGSAKLAAALTAVIFVVSLALCIVLTPTDDGQNWAFYLMPLRAWEFMAGGLLGFVIPRVRQTSPFVGGGMVIAGFALILYAVLGFEHGAPFPSWRAIVPVLGTCLVIAGGIAWPETRIVKLVTVPPVLWIGLVSYSWYLWHWPLLAFGRIYNFGERDLALDITMAALALALAVQTYIWVERPSKHWRFRHQALMRSWTPTIWGLGSSAHVLLAGFYLYAVMPPRVEMTIPPGLVAKAPSTGGGRCRLENKDEAGGCLTQAKGRPVGLVVGDSHSIAALPVLRSAAAKAGSELAAILPSSCPAMLDTRTYSRSGEFKRCYQMIAKGYRFIKDGEIKPRYAILHSRWVTYTPWKGRWAGNGARFSVGYGNEDGPAEDQHKAFVEQLRRTVDQMRKDGVERVLIVGPVPELYRNAEECIARADKNNVPRRAACSIQRKDVESRRKEAVAWLKEAAAAGQADVRFVDPLNAICKGGWCDPFDGDQLLYRDTNHVSEFGFGKIIAANKSAFDWVLGD